MKAKKLTLASDKESDVVLPDYTSNENASPDRS
jgi:hypothetical protein